MNRLRLVACRREWGMHLKLTAHAAIVYSNYELRITATGGRAMKEDRLLFEEYPHLQFLYDFNAQAYTAQMVFSLSHSIVTLLGDAFLSQNSQFDEEMALLVYYFRANRYTQAQREEIGSRARIVCTFLVEKISGYRLEPDKIPQLAAFEDPTEFNITVNNR